MVMGIVESKEQAKAVAWKGEVCYNFPVVSAGTHVAAGATRHRRPVILRPSHPCRMENEKLKMKNSTRPR